MDNIGHLKFSLVAKAPDWTVTVFRADDKTYYSESLKQFEDTGLLTDYLVSRRDRYFKDMDKYPHSTVLISGIKATQLLSRTITFVYVPLSQVLNADSQIEAILYSGYKLTTCGGIPLRLIGTKGKGNILETVNEEGVRETYLDTIKIVSDESKPEFFDAPKGYKRAKSVREVVAGSKSRVESSEIMDLFHAPKSEHSK